MKSLIVAVTVLVATSAAASPRFQEVEALPIYRRTFTLPPGVHTFQTTALTSQPGLGCLAPDTFMVLKAPGSNQIFNDDCIAGNPASCVSASYPNVAPWTVTVFGKDIPATKTCGLMSLTVDGVVMDSNVLFGGSHIVTSSPITGNQDIQTVNPASGADDTILILYNASYQELGYDNNTGTALSVSGRCVQPVPAKARRCLPHRMLHRRL